MWFREPCALLRRAGFSNALPSETPRAPSPQSSCVQWSACLDAALMRPRGPGLGVAGSGYLSFCEEAPPLGSSCASLVDLFPQ